MNAGYPRLVGDIGGTHARFAFVHEPAGAVQAVADYRVEQFPSLWHALRRYLDEHAAAAVPNAVAIGIATPVTGDEVRMTNHAWSFSIRELQRRLGVPRLLVINDFAALALSLPALPAEARRQVGGGTAVAGAPVALIGPGTGLGVSGLLPLPDGGAVPVSGEGGHVTLSSFDDFEAAVLAELHRRFGHASAERALSGPGLQNLHRAVCAQRGDGEAELSAPAITAAALAGTDAACVQALTMFCGLLGSVAGNLALTLGARGGVYIGGGIVPQLGRWFDASPFRERFEAKGRFSGYLAAIPSFVVDSASSPALLGAARALDLLH